MKKLPYQLAERTRRRPLRARPTVRAANPSTRAKIQPGKFYVVDRVERKVVGGPFDTRAQAETDRKGSNIAGDLFVWKAERRANEAGTIVRDFSTLPEIIEHARREGGATHVKVAGVSTTIYYPQGSQYEEAKVWRQGGYWHGQAPGDRTVVARLPAGALSIDDYLARGWRRTAEARRGRAAEARRGPERLPMTQESALQLAGELAGKVSGSAPKPLPGGFRWSQKNEAAQFTTYSPEYGQKVVVVVSVFENGETAINIFSDEELSGIGRYEGVGHTSYAGPDVAEMVKDIRWVWETVDRYAASWQEEGAEVDEARRRPPHRAVATPRRRS